MSRAAAVVIGRNEGPRVARCIRSILPHFHPIVFVDSGSTDGTPETARSLGADVIDLLPFTFGRGHNAGARRARELAPEVEFVQFVDADSEILPTWGPSAVAAMDKSPRLAAVHGRVRERDSTKTIYTRLYELEFDPQIRSRRDIMGGMGLVRMSALEKVGGYVETLSAFEDHDLCLRLAHAGFEVRRLDLGMAVHEARMMHWRQWWRRERRAGDGRAQLVSMHGWRVAEWRRALVSVCFWGGMLPASIFVAAFLSRPVAPLLGVGYAALFYRIYRRLRRRGLGVSDAALYAAACVVGKVPQFSGVVAHLRDKVAPA